MFFHGSLHVQFDTKSTLNQRQTTIIDKMVKLSIRQLILQRSEKHIQYINYKYRSILNNYVN